MRDRRGGFTLIEVLLVVAILVILASVVVLNYSSFRLKSQKGKAKLDITALETACEAYAMDVGMYPSTQAGLSALVQPPGDLPSPDKWGPEPYLKKGIPQDPWDRPYQYQCPGARNTGSFDIWTVSPDGTEIGNW